MHRTGRNLLIAIFFFSLLLAGCGTTPATAPVPATASPAATVAFSPNATATAQAVREACKLAVDAGLSAYHQADFETAFAKAKEAIALDPSYEGGWKLYRLVSVANAANDYLTELPEDRYRITPEQYLQERAAGKSYVLIDIREPDEFAAGHIDGAVNIPMRSITQRLDDLPRGKGTPILLYCHSARRSAYILTVLRMLGYTEVYHLKGGFAAYQNYLQDHPDTKIAPAITPTPGEEEDFGC
ncbi:MAG: hypothetical protein GXP41_10420 [Chloroflexi bacterium]|nr:hypothetical protein [Chloroflexota bacterium]